MPGQTNELYGGYQDNINQGMGVNAILAADKTSYTGSKAGTGWIVIRGFGNDFSKILLKLYGANWRMV
jgi:hypothetical protein